MADIVIKGKLAERLQRIARQKQRPIEDVLEDVLKELDQPSPDAAPSVSQAEAMRELDAKIYAMARDYWRRVGDQERLALTDDELDEQFWLIDPDDIPRLKSDQGTVHLPPDPLETIVGFFADSDLTDMSTTVEEAVAAHYRKKYERPD